MTSLLATGLICILVLWLRLSYRHERNNAWSWFITLVVIAALAGAIVTWMLNLPWPTGPDWTPIVLTYPVSP